MTCPYQPNGFASRLSVTDVTVWPSFRLDIFSTSACSCFVSNKVGLVISHYQVNHRARISLFSACIFLFLSSLCESCDRKNYFFEDIFSFFLAYISLTTFYKLKYILLRIHSIWDYCTSNIRVDHYHSIPTFFEVCL